MKFISLAILSIAGLATASPTMLKKRVDRGTSTQVVVKNNCPVTIQLGQLANGGNPLGPEAIATGASKSYTYDGVWSGRFWARENCSGSDCAVAGAAVPASLAEFTFFGGGNQDTDFYDLSFVDGFNLPLQITANSPLDPTASTSKYWCGNPTCATLPACSTELQLNDSNGNFIGCLSACSKFGNSEYCCTGDHSTPDTCPINSYAQTIKNACPDVYSYAYDDQASTYTCASPVYTITYCP